MQGLGEGHDSGEALVSSYLNLYLSKSLLKTKQKELSPTPSSQPIPIPHQARSTREKESPHDPGAEIPTNIPRNQRRKLFIEESNPYHPLRTSYQSKHLSLIGQKQANHSGEPSNTRGFSSWKKPGSDLKLKATIGSRILQQYNHNINKKSLRKSREKVILLPASHSIKTCKLSPDKTISIEPFLK